MSLPETESERREGTHDIIRGKNISSVGGRRFHLSDAGGEWAQSWSEERESAPVPRPKPLMRPPAGALQFVWFAFSVVAW